MNVSEIIDDNKLLCNCTNHDDIMTIEISKLFLIISLIPCLLSIICCISFLSYNFIKVLINKNESSFIFNSISKSFLITFIKTSIYK